MTDARALRFLDDLREAVVAARFADLPALVAEAEAVLATLSTLPSSSLQLIRAAAERNAPLIRAAEAGVRAGRRRLVEPPVTTLGVYDTKGRQDRGLAAPAIEHRA